MIIVYIKKNQFAKDTGIEEKYYLNNGFTKVEVNDIYSDCQYQDFNEDFTFNVVKYHTRKEQEKAVDYENKVVALIRKKYNINQELAIIRQRYTKPEEFAVYNNYVEQCKEKIKNE